MRVGVLVSGRGSNLRAMLRAVAAGELPGVQPVLVVANRPRIPALEVATAFGIPTVVLRRAAFATPDDRDAAIGRALRDAGAELALLAGYDQLLRAGYFAAFGGRTINIHPSLLPRHGGAGMMGLAVHRAVLRAGDVETGVTLHEVTPELDGGPIIGQARLAVRAGETADELAARVLSLEHDTLVATLATLARDRAVEEPSVSMAAAPGAAASERGAS